MQQFNSIELSSILNDVDLEIYHLIAVQRKYTLAKPILEYVQNMFLPLMEELQLQFGIELLRKCTPDDVMLIIIGLGMQADLHELVQTEGTKQTFLSELQESIQLLQIKG